MGCEHTLILTHWLTLTHRHICTLTHTITHTHSHTWAKLGVKMAVDLGGPVFCNYL